MTSDLYIYISKVVQFPLCHFDTFSPPQIYKFNFSIEFPDGPPCHQFSNLIYGDMFQKKTIYRVTHLHYDDNDALTMTLESDIQFVLETPSSKQNLQRTLNSNCILVFLYESHSIELLPKMIDFLAIFSRLSLQLCLEFDFLPLLLFCNSTVAFGGPFEREISTISNRYWPR